MISIVLRLVLLVVVIYWSSILSLGIANTIFDTSEVIKVDGILNIAGTYGTLLISIYLFFWWLGGLVEVPFPMGDINKALLFIMLIVTPLLTMGTYSKIHSNLGDYVECKSERKFSSRYSSRTYAINEDVCLSLQSEE